MRAYDILRFHLGAAALALGVLLLGAAPSAVSAATTVSNDAAFGRFMFTTVGAGQGTVSYGSNGVPLASPSPATLSTDGGSALSNTRTGSFSNPSGNPVQVTGVGKYGGAKLAPVLLKGLKALPAIGTGLALYDLFKELGMDPAKNPDGSINYRKVDPAICTEAPCYYWTVIHPYAGSVITTRKTRAEACAAAAQYFGGGTCTYASETASNVTHPDGRNFGPIVSRTATTYTPDPVSYLASNEQEYVDAIALKSGWPTSSALAAAVAQATQLTGDTVAPDSVTVTGPATSTGPEKTTVNTDGSKVVSTPTYAHTYTTNNITTVTTTTNNYYNSSNVLTGTSTETAAPETKKGDCEVDPNRIGCRDLGDVPGDEIPAKTKTVTYAPEELGFGSGSCPAPYVFTNRLGTYSLDLAQYCAALINWVRPAVILVATFLAFLIVTGQKLGGDD